MKIFSIILCLIPLCFCAGQKRTRPSSEQPQDLLPVVFSKDAFQNISNEILHRILYFLPIKYQQSFSLVNRFWFNKFNFFRKTNLDCSRRNFQETIPYHSKVPLGKLLQVIDSFTNYWEILCQNSKDANFLNERPYLETKLGFWLSGNMDQIMSLEWNTVINKEGDTLSYILLQRLLFSPYFLFTLEHPIWEAMKAHNEIRIKASCDFLLQAPIIIGKAAIKPLLRTVDFMQLFQIAVARGIELEMKLSLNNNTSWLCTNFMFWKLALAGKIHIDLKTLAHDRIPLQPHLLKLESAIIEAIETGSISIFKHEFIAGVISKRDANYKTIKEGLILDEFELAYIYPYTNDESYVKSMVSYAIKENSHFLPFLFRKTLASQTPNQSWILMFLCSSIPKKFEYHQINIVAIVSILSPIISEFLLPNVLEEFYQKTGKPQIIIFEHIIKKEIDRLVFNLKAESIKESYACIEKELKNTALIFNTTLPVFPFSYHLSFTETCKVTDRIGLYFLTKIGPITNHQSLLISCGQLQSADRVETISPPRLLRKVTLPDDSEVDVFCRPTYTKQAQEDSNNENGNDK